MVDTITYKSLDLSKRTADSLEFCQKLRDRELLKEPTSKRNPRAYKELEKQCEFILKDPGALGGLNSKFVPGAIGISFFIVGISGKLFFSHTSTGAGKSDRSQIAEGDRRKFSELVNSLRDRISAFINTVQVSNGIFINSDKHFDFKTAIDISDFLGLDSLGEEFTSEQISELIEKMSSESFHAEIELLSDHFTNWAFDRALPNLTYRSRQLKVAMAGESDVGRSLAIVEMNLLASRLNAINDAFTRTVHKLGESAEYILDNASSITPNDMRGLKTLIQELKYIRGVMHDMRNFFGYATNLTEFYSIDPESDVIETLLNAIDELDLERLENNVRVAAMLHHSDASEKQIELSISNSIPNIENIPTNISRLIFRTVGELVLNAIKYADMKKNARWISVEVVKNEKTIDVVVEDNGVGIKDITKVLTHGGRERPDLADGSGTGLAALSELAEKMGFKLSIESNPGTGSKISLKGIDISSWGNGGPSGGSGGRSETGKSSSFAGFLRDAKMGAGNNILMHDEVNPAQELSYQIFDGTQSIDIFTMSLFGISPAISAGAAIH